MEYRQIKELFGAAQSGDQNAKEQIYLSYFQPVFRYIFIRLRHQHDAEDIAQTVFLKFYGSLERFTFQKEPLAYLFTIARNCIIDHLRKRKAEPLENAEYVLVDTPLGAEIKYDIAKLLLEIDERHREALILRFISGYSAEEIAIIMKTSAGNIRQMQSRALNKLRKLYETKQSKNN